MTLWRDRTNPLIRRMAEDMLLRNLAQKTIDSYTDHIARFAVFVGKPIEEATPEDVRAFQLHLVQERKVSWTTWSRPPVPSTGCRSGSCPAGINRGTTTADGRQSAASVRGELCGKASPAGSTSGAEHAGEVIAVPHRGLGGSTVSLRCVPQRVFGVQLLR